VKKSDSGLHELNQATANHTLTTIEKATAAVVIAYTTWKSTTQCRLLSRKLLFCKHMVTYQLYTKSDDDDKTHV